MSEQEFHRDQEQVFFCQYPVCVVGLLTTLAVTATKSNLFYTKQLLRPTSEEKFTPMEPSKQ